MSKFPIRGGSRSYKSVETEYVYKLDCYNVPSRVFSIPYSWKVSHIIQFLMDHLDPTFVDNLNYYSSTCPIRHLLQLSVSCGSQNNTVQRSSPHKCGQKSNCNAFNAVVTGFSQIFWVSFLFVCLCGMFPSMELLGGSFQLLENFKLESPITICSSSAYSTSLNKTQCPIYDFQTLIPTKT